MKTKVRIERRVNSDISRQKDRAGDFYREQSYNVNSNSARED